MFDSAPVGVLPVCGEAAGCLLLQDHLPQVHCISVSFQYIHPIQCGPLLMWSWNQGCGARAGPFWSREFATALELAQDQA